MITLAKAPSRGLNLGSHGRPRYTRIRVITRRVIRRADCISVLNTFLSVCSSSLLIACQFQFRLLFVVFLEACHSLVVPRMFSFSILSMHVTHERSPCHPRLVDLSPFTRCFVVVQHRQPNHYFVGLPSSFTTSFCRKLHALL